MRKLTDKQLMKLWSDTYRLSQTEAINNEHVEMFRIALSAIEKVQLKRSE